MTEWLRTALITYIFLLFDFDPQANKYDPRRLRLFQGAFVDSTGDQGRMLLSYPMIEAYKDACVHSFDEFCSLEASQPLSAYKRAVNDRLREKGKGEYSGIKAYDRETFARCMGLSIAKARHLTSRAGECVCYEKTLRESLASQCDEVDLVGLFLWGF